MRPQTDLFVHELLGALPAGARVLDLGCGQGSFRYADFPGLRIEALDASEPPARAAWPAHVQFHRAPAERLPFPDRTIDLVIGNFVFEHTRDFERAIGEVDRVLVDGGALYLSVPNAASFEDNLYRALFAAGGHHQRFDLGSLLRTIYARTGLKLVAFADWPAGFTFFEEREGLRAFTWAIAGAIERAGAASLTPRSNFVMALRKEVGFGYRQVARVCSYCGSADVEPAGDAERGPDWACRTCGRTTAPRLPSLADLDRLEGEMQDLWRRHSPRWSARIGRLLERLIGRSR